MGNAPRPFRLDSEKLAYWYLRLNGYMQIENFYVHPRSRGSARTDADLIAVRFPHRAERLYDDPNTIMQDDRMGLCIPPASIDVVIAEIKTGRCGLNGPWTNEGEQNINRVLAAIGCVEHETIDEAARSLYRSGCFETRGLHVRLICFGREQNPDITETFPAVVQIEWASALGFIYDRFDTYRRQKTQTDHWDRTGMVLKRQAEEMRPNRLGYIAWGLEAIRNADAE